MTSPTAPGQVSQPVTRLEQEVRELRRLVQELQRKDLSNANVGQGGRLRGLYSNGSEAFQFGKDPADGQNKSAINFSSGNRAFSIGPGAQAYGGQETLVIRDLAGATVFVTDELAGYGLSHPELTYSLGGQEEQDYTGATSAATAATRADGLAYVYNPAIHVMCRMRNRNTTASTFNAFLEIADGLSGATVATSSTQTFSVGAGVISIGTFERMCLVPQYLIGNRVVIRVRVWNTSGSNALTTLYPRMCTGTSLAWFNRNPAIQ